MAISASTSRSKTSRVRETTRGVTPASPVFREMRVTSNALAFTPTRVTSAEIRSDRQVTDQILTKFDIGGQIGAELSFGALETEFEEAVQGAWANAPSITVVTIDTEISDVSTTTLTVASGGAAFKAGHLTRTLGFATAGNNALERVSSSSGTTIVYPASTFTAEGAQIPVGASVRVVGFQGASGDIVATTSGGNALTSTALDFTTLGMTVGQWVHIGGDAAGTQFATAACQGWARISAIAATRLSFDQFLGAFAGDSGTSKTIQVFFGDFVVNSTTQYSVTIERQQQDIASPSYEYFVGQQIDTFSMPFEAGKILAPTIGYIGQGTPSATTTRVSGASDVAAPTNPVLSASSNVGTLALGGSLVTGPAYLMSVGFDLKNNLAAQPAINNIGPIGVLDGSLSVSGSFSAYFSDLTLLNAVLQDTDTSLTLRTGRSDGERSSLMFDIPSVKLSGTSTIKGANQSRMFDGSYAAKRHGTLGYTISIGRYWYLPGGCININGVIMRLSEIKGRTTLVEKGDWIESPHLPGVSVKVRGYGNSDYRVLQASQMLRATEGDENATAEENETELLHKTILVDWRGIEDESGNVLPYSSDLALTYLTDESLRLFRDTVKYGAGALSSRRKINQDKIAGNS